MDRGSSRLHRNHFRFISWQQEFQRQTEEGQEGWKWCSKGNNRWVSGGSVTARGIVPLTLVVVVVGSPLEPMTKAISVDLERRGYIVYITVSSAEEEHVIKSQHTEDIRPLWLDLTVVGFSLP